MACESCVLPSNQRRYISFIRLTIRIFLANSNTLNHACQGRHHNPPPQTLGLTQQQVFARTNRKNHTRADASFSTDAGNQPCFVFGQESSFWNARVHLSFIYSRSISRSKERDNFVDPMPSFRALSASASQPVSVIKFAL